MQDTLSEGAARAAQLAPSAITAPAQSEDLPPEVWWPTLSDDERLVYATRVPPQRGWRGGVSEIDAVERGALWHKGQSRKVRLYY